MTDFDARAVAVAKGLAMDAPHAARSGHQGTAMALAPLAHVLFSRVMTYDPVEPQWPDRDRFVLSAGHASILQYAFLHLAGFAVTADDLRSFRQWGSKTPGHPEVGQTPGVEVTTGPLGQGLANMAGMAIAEAQLRSRYGSDLFDHHVFGIAGDGDMCEGVSHEAASLAGHLGLGKIVLCYDDNRITIDGRTDLAFSDDTAARFRAYGWHVSEVGDCGEDLDALEAALREAMAVQDRPSLLVLRTVIAGDATRSADTAAAHGYAIFDTEISETKAALGLADEPFAIPDDLLAQYRSLAARGGADRQAWQQRLDARCAHGPSGLTGAADTTNGANQSAAELNAQLAGTGTAGWEQVLPVFDAGDSVATRKACNAALQALVEVVPGLTGGGADLTGNTGTVISGHGVFSAENPAGRQIYFGVREHAMGAIANGMALHGGAIPVVGTFLVFADYMRPAVRLAALSKARVVFVWSHDSVGVGEDGPTHQPVEHVASLRAIPGLRVIRPADANETASAFKAALELSGPTAIVTSRQSLPVLEGTAGVDITAGGYVLRYVADPDVVLAGTGSEVSVCVEAAELLAADGISARVASLPCLELFAESDHQYRRKVIPDGVPSLAVEAGVAMGWHALVDDVVSIERFGASAPGTVVLAKLGITADNVADRARRLVTAACRNNEPAPREQQSSQCEQAAFEEQAARR